MIYQAALTVPANTPEDAPVIAILRPTVSYIQTVSVYFRDGCLDAVGVRIEGAGSHPIAPLPGGQWFKDNNYHIVWSEGTILEGPPFLVYILGYSLAVDWPHIIDVRMEIISNAPHYPPR